MTTDTCGDDRFELIEEAKRRLIESTNIEDRPEELAVLDSILFRFWQMGWLDQLREDEGAETCQIEERHGDWYCTGCGEMVGTYDTTSELYIDGNAIKQWRRCPNCGKRIKED